MRPPFETFKGATCKGSYVLGSACGHCERCEWERREMNVTNAKPLEPHQQRVVLEAAELGEKLGKLAGFIVTPVYHALDPAERIRLRAQLGVMREYSDILTERIKAFSQ